jgi:hypothetical protein
VVLGGRVLVPCRAALPPKVLSCRLGVRRQGLNAVRHGSRNAVVVRPATMWFGGICIFLETFGSYINFSKIKEEKYKKKSEGDKDVNYKAHEGLKQPT